MRKYKQLNALKVKNEKKIGLHPDGDGLYLRVSKSLSKTWVFRYKYNKKRTDMGLGSVRITPLSEARSKVMDLKKILRDGKDPIHQKREAQRSRLLEAMTKNTFKDCAENYIKDHELEWKNEKHKYQWRQSLSTYAYPTLGNLSIKSIDTNLILKALKPIWSTKTETATRLRGRIELVLDWAAARKMRDPLKPCQMERASR